MELLDKGSETNGKRRTCVPLLDELVVEILSWLPVEHLWLLRCVCKTWYKLLTSDLQFANLHFDRAIESRRNPSILTRCATTTFYWAADYANCDKAIQLLQPFDKDVRNYTAYGRSCNGLLCLSHILKLQVHIWNPLTTDHIIIPYPPMSSRFPGLQSGFDFSFGFHQASKEYKVIKIFSEYSFKTDECHSHVSVYTLGVASTWRTIEEDFGYKLHSPGTLVNGNIHWLASMSWLYTIVAFDLQNECLIEIPIPSDVKFDKIEAFPEIGELGGFLCMSWAHYGGGFQISVMKEYGAVKSWTKQFSIERGSYGNMRVRPLGSVAQNGDIILLVKGSKELILYDQKTSSIKNLNQFCFQCYFTHSFIGSIISPTVINGTRHFMT